MRKISCLRMIGVLAAVVTVLFAGGGIWAEAAGDAAVTLDEKWSEDNQKLVALIKEKKVEEAQKTGEAMLAYLEKKKLMDGPEAGTTYNNLGTIYMYTGAFGKSQAHLLKALKLRAGLFGENSLEVAAVWINLSQLYKLQAQRIIKAHQKEDGDKGKE